MFDMKYIRYLLCILYIFLVNIYFKTKKPGALRPGFIRLNAK